MAATRKSRTAPVPGKPVRGSRSGRPVMALLDLLGRRWALRVLWELRGERRTFRALQEACDGVSPAVLNDRVRELRESGLVDVGEGEGYGLSPIGRELLAHLAPIAAWSERWAASPSRRRR
ncbi:MAG TPA: helix-turn-helix domain-containing protein [Candidatus Binatia bacterium]|nr:helix-turn-helix domain-containing protein [Candidatus Binatia bacterium]